MILYIAVLVIVTAIFYQIGISNLIYVSVSIAAFLYGYLFFDPVSVPYFMKAYKCQISKGLPKIVKNMKETEKTVLDSHISGSVELDKAFKEVIDLLLRDYVECWYKHITSDQNMLHEMKRSIYKIVSNFSQRCHSVDWVSVITEDLPHEIGSHIRLFRLSNQHCRHNKERDEVPCDISDMHEEFFSLESETDKLFCRQKICTDLAAEKDYLSNISEFILYIVTTQEEFNVPAVRYFLRECFLNAVFLPVINLLADPDFINQYIVWMCKDNSYTSEYFIQAIRMSDNRDEMAAVIERLDLFSTRLRSRDSGGDQDALIKAQLGSLDFVKKVCQSRLAKLEEPMNEDQSSLKRSLSTQSLSSITLEYVLDRQIGISLFIDFLSMIGSQNYLITYNNIIQYQIRYQKIVEPVDDVFYFSERRLDASISDYSDNNNHDSDQRLIANKILRDSKMLKLSKNVLILAEEKIVDGDLSPDVFDGILKEIIEILREKRHFETFRKSKYFGQFLDEIDYLCEDSLASEEEISDNLSVNSNVESPPIGVIQTIGESDVYNVRIVDSDIIKNSYVLYTLVIIKTDKYGNKETWKTQKRYREFVSLHNAILELCGRHIPMKLPPKKPFYNMTNEFLEKRSLDLQEYLASCLDPKMEQQYSGIRNLVVQFIKPNIVDSQSTLNRMQSIVNPFKTVGNAVLAMPDNLVGNFSRLYSSISPSKKLTNPRINDSHILGGDQLDYAKFGNDMEQGKAESIPIRILFLLVDEIFDLQNKSQVVRKGIFGILRKIVKTFFGLKVNKIILEKAAKFTSSDQVAEFVKKFKDYMWPNGKLAASATPRDYMTKMRTRILCKTKMLGSVSDEVSQFLGNETTRQGVQRVFDLCQDQILNKRLTYCILQVILQKIFPGHNFELLMQHKLCPAHCGKVCNKHQLTAPDWRDWSGQ